VNAQFYGGYTDLGPGSGGHTYFQYVSGVGYYSAGLSDTSASQRFSYNYDSGQWRYRGTSSWYNLGPSALFSSLATVRWGDMGLRWTFGSGIDPGTFGFDPSSHQYYNISYDSGTDGFRDLVLYYDVSGHNIARGAASLGSMGTRIAIYRTYVGGSSTWTSYWNYWSSSNAESPLVEVYNAAGERIFGQVSTIYVYPNGSIRYAELRDGRALYWEDSNGNGLRDDSDRIIWWRQQRGGTCGIFASVNIAESASLTHSGNTRALLDSPTYDDNGDENALQWFSTTYSFNPPYSPSLDLYNMGDWGGTNRSMRDTYLTGQWGFRNPTDSTVSLSTLVSWLDSGRMAHVALDAYEIWASLSSDDLDHDGYIDASRHLTNWYSTDSGPHAVWVRGVQRDTGGNITHVLIADSALYGGAIARVPLEHFLRACRSYIGLTYAASDINSAVIYAGVLDPPSGYSWGTAGTNTWRFNPAVWSASW